MNRSNSESSDAAMNLQLQMHLHVRCNCETVDATEKLADETVDLHNYESPDAIMNHHMQR
jgi:hypothetical protein